MKKVCHITTVHPAFDVRIFHKELKSLSEASFSVSLIAQHERDETINDIRIISLPKPRNRLDRFFSLGRKSLSLALNQGADIYHFHDPELLPWMARLKKKTGANVIYDVHEDYVSGIRQKRYIPSAIRGIVASIFNIIEGYYSNNFTKVLAEKYYIERFPDGVTILNYPAISSHLNRGTDELILEGKYRVLCTGNITEDRGAIIHADLVSLMPLLHVYMVGKCEDGIIEKINNLDNRIHIEGDGYIPHERIKSYYKSNKWLAALAIFPKTDHYYRKELTKFFEYMEAGIPIIASNFPTWKRVVEENECGLCVDPENKDEIKNAIEYLIENPKKAKKMGENGKKAVAEKYNWAKEKEKLLELYDILISNE